tara:strand:- start:1762 stop:2013 length:252 start_codon:yes stop_codon:yes gene_type:complete
MTGRILRLKLIVLLSLLSLANGCRTTKTEAISIPEVPQDIVQRMMTHPQIDKAWEEVPEFTRDVLKTISDQATQLELENITNN